MRENYRPAGWRRRPRRVLFAEVNTHFPSSLTTPRLLLRTWHVDEAPQLKSVIDANLGHLQAWMAWAVHEPSPLEVIAARIQGFATDFAAGEAAVYAIRRRSDDAVVGGAGVERRDEDVVEVGYWLDQCCMGHGIATEAAGALAEMALQIPGIARVQIRCDPAHSSSAAVARRSGFVYRTTLLRDTITPSGSPRDTMVWELTARRSV